MNTISYICVIRATENYEGYYSLMIRLVFLDGQQMATMSNALPQVANHTPTTYGLVSYPPLVNGGVTMSIPPPPTQQPLPQSIMTPVINGSGAVNSGAPHLGQLPIRSMGFSNGYQPVIYVYPTPPISPQGQYYLTPNGLSLKGVQYTTNGDMVQYMDGSYEVRHN